MGSCFSIVRSNMHEAEVTHTCSRSNERKRCMDVRVHENSRQEPEAPLSSEKSGPPGARLIINEVPVKDRYLQADYHSKHATPDVSPLSHVLTNATRR